MTNNIATPVTIETNLGTFEIYNGSRVDGHISRCTPRDAHGNLIVNNQAYKTDWGTNKPTIKYWKFSEIYNNHSTQNENKQSYSDYNGKDGGNSWGENLANSMSRYADRASQIECRGYSNFQLRAGWSLHFGEMLTAKAQLGGVGGYVLAGGVGKDYFLDNPENSISWYFAAGIYKGDEEGNDYTFNAYFGRNQVKNGIMVGLEFEYSHFFVNAPHWGYYLGGRAGIYAYFDYGKTPSIAGDIHAGVTCRLF